MSKLSKIIDKAKQPEAQMAVIAIAAFAASVYAEYRTLRSRLKSK